MDKKAKTEGDNGKQVTLFKVCQVSGGKYFSSQYGTLPKVLVKEYKRGETTVPDVGYLFAFKTLEDAKNAFRHERTYVTLKCKGIIVKELNNRGNIDVIGPDSVYREAKRSYRRVLSSWWKWFFKPNGIPESVRPYIHHRWGCPANTVLCSEITPTSVVK